jgi:hypothetical protein
MGIKLTRLSEYESIREIHKTYQDAVIAQATNCLAKDLVSTISRWQLNFNLLGVFVFL